MKNRYKISEIAKIFNISRQTLIFYHKKNILIPDIIDEENGYRYYSNEQIWDLFFLLTLKKARFSLEEIKAYSEIKNSDKSIIFLENKINEIDKKISELKKSKKTILKKLENIRDFSSTSTKEEEFKIEEIENIKWYSIDMKEKTDEVEMATNYEKLNSFAKKYSIDDIEYITMTEIENIENVKIDGGIVPVEKVGIVIPKNIVIEKSEELILGKVISIKYNNPYSNLVKTYQNLKSYIEKNGYKTYGYAIEIAHELTISTEKGIGGILKIVVPIK
ncbi:MerR family transcriptional regulator [uncultured Fusobacterium sp.]|mgnify:FL=1|uniref:MerR family transcriptional regulator n=1 Tax=uncultured Fusobacterium sp. TaxID=159267 RepID=UPI002805F194|nr:MerR family transcriptional regulator [uncultured Fusobacterium sp.]